MIRVKLLTMTARLPEYATEEAAGVDLRSDASCTIYLAPGETRVVKTGLALDIPRGYEGQVRSRSGLAKDGIVVANSPGTIDSDYRGEIGVILHNQSPYNWACNPGDRIAQLVFAPVTRAQFEIVEQLGATERGSGGFGSTGVR